MEFAQHLKVGGYIFFHDTNVHPGPCVILDALDRKVFEVKQYLQEDRNDWGVAVAKRIK